MTSQGLDPWDFTCKIPNVNFTAICGSISMTSIFFISYDFLLNFRKKHIFEKVKIEEGLTILCRGMETVPKNNCSLNQNISQSRLIG